MKNFILKVKIVSFAKNDKAEEIFKFSRGQKNVNSKTSRLRVLRTWALHENSKIFQSMIEMDTDTHTLAMKRGKLFENFCLYYL